MNRRLIRCSQVASACPGTSSKECANNSKAKASKQPATVITHQRARVTRKSRDLAKDRVSIPYRLKIEQCAHPTDDLTYDDQAACDRTGSGTCSRTFIFRGKFFLLCSKESGKTTCNERKDGAAKPQKPRYANVQNQTDSTDNQPHSGSWLHRAPPEHDDYKSY